MSVKIEPAPLILSPWMSVERVDDLSATVYLASDGARLRIPLPLHRLLMRFISAADPADVCGFGESGMSAWRAISKLRDKGFLVRADSIPKRSPRLVSDPPVRLFDAPAQKLSAVSADVVVLGMPWDFGSPEAVGARRGPLALRELSLQILYSLDRLTGRPQGWFDAHRKCPVLAGISIADAGDVLIHHGERHATAFARAEEVLSVLTAGGALPVLIGGDASAAHAVIRVSQHEDPLHVIRVGRPSSFMERCDRGNPTAATLAAHALSMPHVERYTDVTPRGGEQTSSSDGRYRRIAIDQVTSMEAGHPPLDDIDRVRLHLGLDLDAMARAKRQHAEPSFTYLDVHALLDDLGRRYRIVSIDLCGANPSAPCWEPVAMTGLHLLLTALSAAKDSP